MGQKIHPHGLRIGLNRKWNSSWYAEKMQYKTFFYAQFQLEQFLKAFLHLYPYVKHSATKRASLVDLKWIRSGISQLYLFIFFYKFRTRKRRWDFNRFVKKKTKNKITMSIQGKFKSKVLNTSFKSKEAFTKKIKILPLIETKREVPAKKNKKKNEITDK